MKIYNRSKKTPRSKKEEEIENELLKIKEAKGKRKTEPISSMQKWINALINRKIVNIDDIKAYFKDKSIEATDYQTNVIKTILGIRQVGEKIQFDTLSNVRLHNYVYVPSIPLRFLSNDFLFFSYLSKNFAKNDVDQTAVNEFINRSYLSDVKIISNNFSTNKKIFTGFIQDYDPKYLALIENMDKDELKDIINQKPNLKKFRIEGEDFISFGVEKAFFIVPEVLSNDDIFEKANNMKFFHSDKNVLKGGLRDLKQGEINYMDKDVFSETFCPSFIMFPEDITFSFLMNFEYDYNELYDLISTEQKSDKPDRIFLPSNLCYWDTMTQFFDFIGVLALTNTNLSEAQRQYLGDYYTEYFRRKTAITKWKKAQLSLQRIIQDFVNCFLNDSELARFINLYKKVVNYISERESLKKKYFDTRDFLAQIPFSDMIANQFKDDVMGIADEIKNILERYTSGTKDDNLADDIKKTLKRIYSYLPEDNIKNAAFPLIFPDGGILADVFSQDVTFDRVAIKVKEAKLKQEKSKIKEQKEMKQELDYLKNANEYIDKFLEAYLKKRVSRKDTTARMTDDRIKNYIYKIKILLEKKGQIYNDVTSRALEFKRNGDKLPQKLKLGALDAFLKEYGFYNNKVIPKDYKVRVEEGGDLFDEIDYLEEKLEKPMIDSSGEEDEDEDDKMEIEGEGTSTRRTKKTKKKLQKGVGTNK